jgi:hypothetical protein
MMPPGHQPETEAAAAAIERLRSPVGVESVDPGEADQRKIPVGSRWVTPGAARPHLERVRTHQKRPTLGTTAHIAAKHRTGHVAGIALWDDGVSTD